MTRRVLHLRSSSGWAGPERHLVELGSALADEGVEATLVVLDSAAAGRGEEHPLVRVARGAGLAAFALPDSGRTTGPAIAQLARHLGAGGYHLLHSHDYKSNWVGRRAARRAGVPAVATVHLHTRSTLRLRLYHRLDRRELRRCDAVLAVAAALLGDLPPRLANGRQPQVVHNGLDAERLRRGAVAEAPAAESIWPSARCGPRLLAVGRLAPQKGFDLLLPALAALRAEWPGLVLALVGSGPERERLERDVARFALAGAVVLAGERADVAGLMRTADLVVLPSRREGLPYVALEALALERPLVACAAGGVPELVSDGETGWLVEPGSAIALADALRLALAVPECSARLAELVA
jgi:glycosyltransferase involved in cell wall biosynthesis